MSSTFSFTTLGSEYRQPISSNVILHLYRSNHALAIVDFIDGVGNQIPIPTGFMIYTKDFHNNQYVKLKSIGNLYALCWTDDYTMELNKEPVLELRNYRNWNITSFTPDTTDPDVPEQHAMISCDERTPPENNIFVSADGGAICNKCQRFVPSIEDEEHASDDEEHFLAEQQMDEDIDRRWITSERKIAESYNPARCNECFICGTIGHYGKDCTFDANWHQDINNGCWTFYYCDGCGKEFLEEEDHKTHEKTCRIK